MSAAPVVVLDPETFRRTIRDEMRAVVQSERQAPNPPAKPVLSNREVLSLLGISRITLQRYRDSGKIKYSKVGGILFYMTEDVLDFVDRHAR